MTRIKVCGLCREADIAAVNAARPDYAGFVVWPKSRRAVTAGELALLARGLDPAIRRVGVFVDAPVETVAGLYATGAIGIAQLHGTEDGAYIARLRAAAPGIEIWQAVVVREAADMRRAADSAADAVLLDAGKGCGARFDWGLAAGAARRFGVAGGLTPETIPEAIRVFSPDFVDISSGVETDGAKDPNKIMAAVQAARRSGSRK